MLAWSWSEPAAGQLPGTQWVHYDYVDATGQLAGGVVELPLVAGPIVRAPAALAGVLAENGPSSNRIDLVFLGDGYTADELDLYAEHVDNAVAKLFAVEPFKSYRPFFNVHRIDVTSNESGVDNDPTLGIERDTALNMGFWCSGVERLLCVDALAANNYAANAPEVDSILVLANSTKYGGAGYPHIDIATASGGNGSSAEIAIHELGHSFANLADEYDYGGAETYSGREPPQPNVSKLTTDEMLLTQTKWAAWLSADDPAFGGLVDTFEGALYSRYGIYRPTVNSKMRSLGRPFNLPSIEAFLIEFYEFVRPIDTATPTDQLLGYDDSVFVQPLHPATHALEVTWRVDGAVVAGFGETLNVRDLKLPLGTHTLSVTVVDPTDFVRNEAVRAALLSETRTWTVAIEPTMGDCNCDGQRDTFDVDAFILALSNPAAYADTYPDCDPLLADCDGDGQVRTFDVDCFIMLMSPPAPQ